jgi:putative addiction module component (TIGR02574 family)
MPTGLEDVTKVALELPVQQQIVLAGILLGNVGAPVDDDVEAAWDAEIRERIRAIEEGRVTGIPYEDVMRKAARLLDP